MKKISMNLTLRKHAFGSNDMILTVSSAKPTAKNLDRSSPRGTDASAMHTTSDNISLRSVYSFSWPV